MWLYVVIMSSVGRLSKDDWLVHRLVEIRKLSCHHLDGIIATPQSFSQEPLYKSAPNLYEENFRFKGFPGHGFSRPTIPRTVPVEGPIPVVDPPRPAPQRKPPTPQQKPPTPISHSPLPHQEVQHERVPPIKMQDPQSPPGNRLSPDLEHQGYVPSMMQNDNSPPSRRSDPDKENKEQVANTAQEEMFNKFNDEHGLPPLDKVERDPLPPTRFSWEFGEDLDLPPHYFNYNQYLTEEKEGSKPPVSFQEEQPDYTYRSQARPKFDEVNGESPRPIPIRRAYEKTDEEIRKIEQQHIDADRDQRRIQAENRYRDMERLAEQRKDYEMLQNYNPWGKPGAGAPGENDVRKKKFTEEQLAMEDRLNSPNWQRPPDRYIGRDWASKTAEEKQKYRNDLMEQESTRLHLAEKERNADMGREMGGMDRPTPPMGRYEERKLHEQQQRLSELKNELDNVKMGRAQSTQLGGSARESSAREKSAREGSVRSYYEKGMKEYPRRKVYNSWDQYEMKRVQTRDSFNRRRENDDYDPWGKGLGNPHFDPEGNVARHEHMLGRTNKQLPTQIGEHYGNYGSWSAPDRTMDSNEPRIRHNPYDNLGRAGKAKKPNMEPMEIFFPFGKSGAGAPRIDRNARITTQNKGTMSKEEDEEEHRRKIKHQKEYLHELDVLYQQQKRNKDYINEYNKAPPGDLASIMKSKQVGKPRRDPDGNISQNQHLGNSDVSLTKMNRPEKNTAMQQEYLETLNRHNVARQTQRNLDLQKDRQGDRLHQHAIDSWWGNYGGGNKKGPVLQKQNLDVTIHHPTNSFSMTDEYIRNKDWSQIGDEHIQMFPHLDEKNSPRFATYGESSPRIYPRSTVNSTHNNQYDYPWESLPKKDYKIGAPYALH